MRQCVLDKIDEVASVLLGVSFDKEIGLYSGNAGIALFLFYYARFKRATVVHKKAVDIMDGLFSQIENTQRLRFSFCSGIAGVGWLVDHLCKQGFLQADPTEILSDIDNYVFQAALDDLRLGDFDFLHGAMGMLLYLAKRDCREYLRHLIQALGGIAIWEGCCAKWQSVINREEKTVGFNIALSHGSSSLALVLCKILQIIPEDETLKKLLNGAIEYICKQEIQLEKYGCYFPAFSIESQPELFKTRLAWCYGDLGVAMAIWQSGLVHNNKAWIDKGMEILLHAADRRGLSENRVLDAGICHGTAGLTQIFNRLYRDTQQVAFKKAADYWCAETLKMAKFDNGLAGYMVYRTEKDGGWQPTYELLEGITGIGLSLLSFVMEEDPAWDECLLLS